MAEPALGDLDELRPRYLRVVGLACGGMAWLAAVRYTSYGPDWGRSWPVVALLTGGALAGHLLRRRHPRPAAYALAAAMATALLLEAWAYPGYLVVALLPALVVLVAGLSASLSAAVGVYVVLGLVVVDGLAARSLFGPLWRMAAVSAGLATLASVVTARQFETAFHWARGAAHRAESAARDAQKRREEVVATMQALRNAYYLIERTNHALAQAQAELVEARRVKTDFANMVSHELRAPLNFIVGFSELMVSSPEVYGPGQWPQGLRQDIEEIYRSSDHLSKLIDDILDLAQIEAQRVVLKREHCSLSDIAREAADIIRPWMARKGLRFSECYDDDVPPLYLDRTRVRQIVLNLLNNAARFTERGEVTLRVGRDDDHVRLSVTDTGPGIPADDLPRIFQEFVQLDTGFGRPVGGSGLGLAISRRFVEMHGGRIWVESSPGAGSAFHIAFSLAAAPPPLARTDTQSLQAGYWHTLQKQGLARDAIITVGGPRLAGLLAAELEGYELVPGEVQSLPATVRQVRPRAVLVDATQAADEAVVAALESSPHDIPVIAVAVGEGERPDLPGAQAHLTKPVTRARLLETLRRVCPAAERVLVIDDDPRMRRFLAATLEAAGRGYRVETVGLGDEGLRRLAQEPAHVVLLDLCLPGTDGFQVLRAIHDDALLSSIPVVTVSAYINPAEGSTPGRQRVSISCRGALGQSQVAALVSCALEELSPRFRWEEQLAVPEGTGPG